MTHPEGLPNSREIKNPITEADIELQSIEIDNEEERARRILAREAINPEQVEYVARMLVATGQKDDKDAKPKNHEDIS